MDGKSGYLKNKYFEPEFDSQSLPLPCSRNLIVDGCPSKENIFGQSALLMNPTMAYYIYYINIVGLNATYIVFHQGDL